LNSKGNGITRSWLAQTQETTKKATRQQFISHLETSGVDEVEIFSDLYYPKSSFHPFSKHSNSLENFYTLLDAKGKEDPFFGVRYREHYINMDDWVDVKDIEETLYY